MLFSVSQNVLRGDFTRIAETARETYQKIQDRLEANKLVTGVSTGFEKLDEYTNGLQKSDLIVIAGRPSTGKTSLAMNMALHVAVKEQAPVAIFSLEMAREQLAEGMLSMLARVDGKKMRVAHLINSEEWTRIGVATGQLYDAPIFIDDTPGTTALDIRAKARRLAARHGVGMVIVDYLQLVDQQGRGENRNQELSFISRAFKQMARELRVPVVTLSQLSRTVERENRRPILSDLRDSGAIESEADLVAFIHHPGEQRRRQQREHEGSFATEDEMVCQVQVILAKHRNGPTGDLTLMFDKRTRRFTDVDRYSREATEPLADEEEKH
jgi:replicative DNA helicase